MSSLPQSLTSLYASYKESTKYALSWIWMNCAAYASDAAFASFRTTEDIIHAARSIRRQGTEVPRSVVSALIDAIKKRTQVLDIYRDLGASAEIEKDAVADLNHEIFVKRLVDVLQVLLPLRAKQTAGVPGEDESLSTATLNRFAALGHLDGATAVEAEPGKHSVAASPALVPASKPAEKENPYERPAASGKLLLKDDDLGEGIELTFFIYEWDSMCAYINGVWADAAEGRVPIPMAAWLSNLALQRSGVLFECNLYETGIAKSIDELILKWKRHYRLAKGVNPRFSSPKGALMLQQGTGRFAHGVGLSHPHGMLEHGRRHAESGVPRPGAGQRQDPKYVIRRPMGPITRPVQPDDIEMDEVVFDAMHESMRQLLGMKRGIASVEEPGIVSEPLLPLLQQALENVNEPLPPSLVFGFDMLLSTYKAFMWPDLLMNRTNCRLIALRFANDVKRAISEAIPVLRQDQCCCKKPFVDWRVTHFRELVAGLDDFTSEKRFDLYYQAPWASGCHMVQVLNLAFEEGLLLCCDVGYVPAALHMYNALRNVDAPIKRIPLLEDLCEVFKDRLFLGVLPTRNFSSSFRRAMGRGLERVKGPNGTRVGGIAEPDWHSSRRGRADPAKSSLFWQLDAWKYYPSAAWWLAVHGERHARGPSQKRVDRFERESHEVPFNVLLETVKEAVLPELKGPRPVARVNYFAVSGYCTRLLRRLGAVQGMPVGMEHVDGGATLGYHFVDGFLRDLMVYLKECGGARRKGRPAWDELDETKRVFDSLDGKTSLKDFLWSI
ncbi:hypothetical protein ColTof4_03937 [Colletotrichum tofieldiae]|nr:hypothetical protein ColTof3_13784 [Colletotrichum tofieldiae]GKT71514.1 hypothetical protein ColTof4_03937 [Colletotrichum tofieldiae]